jgi:thiol-disulfide isomerase/thioredoxin
MRARFAGTLLLVAALLAAGCSAGPVTETGSGSNTGSNTGSGTGLDPGSTGGATRAPVYDPARDADADIRQAQALAASDGRRVLIDFGADWCPDCQVLDRLYRDERVAPLLAERYHLVTVDVGRFDHNLDLAARYGGVIDGGIPALVVLDPAGAVVTTTKDGSFATARSMTAGELADYLGRYAGR